MAKKAQKVCRTCWLSTSNAVDGVYEDFVPIIQAINFTDDKDGLASYLLSKIKSFKFVGAIYILKAVLPEQAALSKAFQRGTVNFGRIVHAINHTTDKLNITLHFKDSMPVVSAFNLFNPTAIPNCGTSEFTSYGCKEVATLTEDYFPNDEESRRQANAEWEKLKYDLLLWKGQIPEELENVTPTEWCLSLRRPLSMRTDLGHFYHKLVWIAETILSLPVSNAWPERGASAVKGIKSRLQSRMSNQMLEALLQISIYGPPVSKAEDLVKETVKTWSKTKKRRKLPPAVNLGATTSGNSEIPVQTILVDTAIQTGLEADVNEEAEAKGVRFSTYTGIQ